MQALAARGREAAAPCPPLICNFHPPCPPPKPAMPRRTGFCEAAGGHGGGSDAHTAWGQRRHIPHHRVLVQGDVADVAGLLNLGAGQPLGP